MHRFLLPLLLLSFHLSAHAGEDCDPTHPENFELFLYRFAGDKAFAVSRTIYPVSVVEWHHGPDGFDLGPPTRTQLQQAQDEKTPSLDQRIKENGLSSHVLASDFRAAVVEVYPEGGDWGSTYHFQRKGRCWFLREVQDHS